MVRVAINGYGRIGRLAHRIILEKYPSEIDLIAINTSDSTDLRGWMYLLKYDSTYHTLSSKFKVSCEAGSSSARQSSKLNEEGKTGILKDAIGFFIINDVKIPIFSQLEPSLLPWRDLNVDVVIEATGEFRKKEQLQKHLDAGAKKVVLSAPAKGEGVNTYVISVNHGDYKGESVINNASCTTNCVAPVAKIMVDNFGVEKAMMTTIHGYTPDQNLHDGGHKDYRRARASALNIVPTSTGATETTAKALPELAGVFSGLAVRVPVAVGSLSDFTFLLKKEVSSEEVNELFRKEAQNPNYKGILDVTEDPLVSSDIIGNPYSAVVDLSLTQVVGGNLVKIIAWYDNEYGYANRLVEEAIMMGNFNDSIS